MKKTFYGFIFITIVLLICSHTIVEFSPSPWFMGMPFWLYWYMFLHLLLIGGLVFFIKNVKED